MDDDRHDYYAIGTYHPIKNKWTPDIETMDVGIGLRLDYGIFYASKTFYDQFKQRILFQELWCSTRKRELMYSNGLLKRLRALDLAAQSSMNCSTTSGGASRGYLGPFGLVVAADENLSELTPIYFYIAKDTNGKIETHFCADQSRSSLAFEVGKEVHGSKVPVLEGEDFTMRILVDHSILESFAQGGRTVVTSRIYPTKAINEASQVFLFNNATGISVRASVKIWNMGTTDIHAYQMQKKQCTYFTFQTSKTISLLPKASSLFLNCPHLLAFDVEFILMKPVTRLCSFFTIRWNAPSTPPLKTDCVL
ncbi:hypothetical protein Leryth_026061, partial [Lithospermum erythrorhizon]